MANETFDAAVVGGGVVGCAVLRALTLGGLQCVLLERGADILSGASKGNSAILHTGFDAPEGSLELKLMQAGRAEYLAVRERLNLPVVECGALLAGWNPEQAAQLPEILAQAHRNSVIDVRHLTSGEINALLPHLAPPAAAILVPGEYIIDPWSAPLAYAVQAILNGATVIRQSEVINARWLASAWRLDTRSGPVSAKLVINCAGNFGDRVEAFVRPSPFTIRPRKGQFAVFDKTAFAVANRIVLPVPTERTKGVVLFPTVFGNVAIGPTAEEQSDREEAHTDEATLRSLHQEALRLAPALAAHQIIATYAGLRPATEHKSYVIEAMPQRNWITVAGIRSTGLTAALGIGAHVASLIETHFQRLSPIADPIWPKMPNLAEHLPRDVHRPGRGPLACLCEAVTWEEIETALTGPLPAGDLGGLKRRTRAMMGRCQGSNCIAHIVARTSDRLLCPPIAAQ